MNDPLPHAYYQICRSRVVADCWSKTGVYVIPVVQFSEDSIDIAVSHIRVGSVIAVRGPSKSDNLGRWLAACQVFQNRICPDLVIQLGRAEGSDVWANPDIRHLSP